MQQPRHANLEQLLWNLSESSMAYRRREAADAISYLPTSSIQVVAALIVARDCDSHEDVRQAAATALGSEVHQAVLELNSETVMRMVDQTKVQLDKAQVKSRALKSREKQRRTTNEVILLVSLVLTAILIGIGFFSNYDLWKTAQTCRCGSIALLRMEKIWRKQNPALNPHPGAPSRIRPPSADYPAVHPATPV